MGKMANAMTVDVEDYFQVSAFENTIHRDQWDSIPCRVEANTDSILQLFDEAGLKATFFVLGWVAERYPALVRNIVDQGHELASHGYAHKRALLQTRDEFYQDVGRSKQCLEDIGGVEVVGYRAPSYSISKKNLWAHDILADCGYRYSSSVVPVNHDLYGIPDASRFPYRVSEGRLLEIPISTVPVAGRNFNCGGGGWFRLFPYGVSRWAIRQVNRADRAPSIFYFHPWEIDPEQPRVEGAGMKSVFRHYLNLSRTMPRLQRLVRDFDWVPMKDAFSEHLKHDAL
ncbi:XrtA system polysaccharide deacetylase [Pseudomaricurvus sp. HS19]|uniref:XrtA system polysaccharide deacetylase n=1 Tax=Pseudomaricurvus sp. HS19 TaxID=2692626 RepID=UPI00136929B8|nr:XrtA system polysaccharide deacetylase [Pseudomaricurvus sp. HS19]MYM62026.1 DUF3473 domain-containing protein [Pseudomaricurvus sp. HS19]